MRYFLAVVTSKATGQELEYVLPDNSAGEATKTIAKLFGDGFNVANAFEYFGGTWPNTTPE